jgi:hypothetical protein
MESPRDDPQHANNMAFLRDLKYLLEKHYGEYTIYQNGERVTVERDADSACFYVYNNKLGESGKPFLVRRIIPLNAEDVAEIRSS